MKKLLFTLAMLGMVGLAQASADFSKEKCCKSKKCKEMCKKEEKDCCKGGDTSSCTKNEKANAKTDAKAEGKSCCKDGAKAGKACHEEKKQ